MTTNSANSPDQISDLDLMRRIHADIGNMCQRHSLHRRIGRDLDCLLLAAEVANEIAHEIGGSNGADVTGTLSDPTAGR